MKSQATLGEIANALREVSRAAESPVASVSTDVTMRQYDDTEIERYIRSGEPFDKAGAYAIQGEGGALVERVDGCYTNVVGLPLTTTRRLLESWGVLKPEA